MHWLMDSVDGFKISGFVTRSHPLKENCTLLNQYERQIHVLERSIEIYDHILDVFRREFQKIHLPDWDKSIFIYHVGQRKPFQGLIINRTGDNLLDAAYDEHVSELQHVAVLLYQRRVMIHNPFFALAPSEQESFLSRIRHHHVVHPHTGAADFQS